MTERIIYCECCSRKLDPSKAVWLEYDRRDGSYHNFGDIPDDHNQGGFPFGPGCARRKLADAKRLRENMGFAFASIR